MLFAPSNIPEAALFFSNKRISNKLIDNGLKIGNVVKRPIDGLVAHHKELLDTSYI